MMDVMATCLSCSEWDRINGGPFGHCALVMQTDARPALVSIDLEGVEGLVQAVTLKTHQNYGCLAHPANGRVQLPISPLPRSDR